MNDDFIKDILIARKSDAHKGDFGKALIICGSRLMPGAAIIAARQIKSVLCVCFMFYFLLSFV